MTDTIYGEYAEYLPLILEDFSERIQEKNKEAKQRQDISYLTFCGACEDARVWLKMPTKKFPSDY